MSSSTARWARSIWRVTTISQWHSATEMNGASKPLCVLHVASMSGILDGRESKVNKLCRSLHADLTAPRTAIHRTMAVHNQFCTIATPAGRRR